MDAAPVAANAPAPNMALDYADELKLHSVEALASAKDKV